MNIAEIKTFPRTFQVVTEHGRVFGRSHESLLRSFQILAKAKEWLRKGTPAEVVLEMIEDIEFSGDVDPLQLKDKL